MIVLDTDHLTLLSNDLGEAGDRLRARLERVDTEEVFTTIVTYEEQSRGWLARLAKVQSSEQLIVNYQHLNEHIEDYRSIRVLEFDRAASIVFEDLKRSRIRIGTMDLRIASIVHSREATLLSRNLADFRKVPDLKVEDWSA